MCAGGVSGEESPAPEVQAMVDTDNEKFQREVAYISGTYFFHLPTYFFHLPTYFFHLPTYFFHLPTYFFHLPTYFFHLLTYFFHSPTYEVKKFRCAEDVVSLIYFMVIGFWAEIGRCYLNQP